jgi:transcription antitermination factor NusA-like protein
MALGRADVAATTNTKVYQVPVGKTASVNINVCNRNSTAAKIRIALSVADTPVVSEYLEYDFSLSGNNTIERTCVIANAGDRVVVYSDVANVSAVVTGFED